MTKVSVIIPVFNCENYLEENIKSVIGQTFRDAEFLYIDDGSVDSSIDIIKKYQKKDARILFFQLSHGGVSRARNYGIKKSSGKYLFFWDCDDVVDPHLISLMIRSLEDSKNSQCAICSLSSFGNEQIDFSDLYGKIITNFGNQINTNTIAKNLYALHILTQGFIGSVGNKVFLSEIIKKYSIKFNVNLYIGEDLLFGLQYFRHCNFINVHSDSLYFYRKYGSQTMYTNHRQSHFALNMRQILQETFTWIWKIEPRELNRQKEQYSSYWIVQLEKAVRNVDWTKEIEITELKGTLDWEYTNFAIAHVKHLHSNLRLDKLIFFKLLCLNNLSVLKLYSKINLMLRNIIRRI